MKNMLKKKMFELVYPRSGTELANFENIQRSSNVIDCADLIHQSKRSMHDQLPAVTFQEVRNKQLSDKAKR